MASMYGVYHGPAGLKGIASRIHGLTKNLADALTAAGLKVTSKNFFDTISVEVADANTLIAACEKAEINVNKLNGNNQNDFRALFYS